MVNGEPAKDGLIELHTIHETWPDLSDQLQVYLFKLAHKEYDQRIELNIEKFNEKIRKEHAFLENMLINAHHIPLLRAFCFISEYTPYFI